MALNYETFYFRKVWMSNAIIEETKTSDGETINTTSDGEITKASDSEATKTPNDNANTSTCDEIARHTALRRCKEKCIVIGSAA